MNGVPDILESPEAVLTTMTSDGKRRWVYPTLSPGRFLSQRRVVAWSLVALYLALPVVQMGGHPAVLLDFIHREFAFFGLVFYPTDTLILMVFLIGIIALVVLFTALLGRVWCGWGCPQTVYLEFVFRPIERFLEGKEHVRKRRDEAGVSLDKVRRKTLKWVAFTVVSAVLAHTFVAYFVGWNHLIAWMTGPPEEHWGFFVLMAATTGLILFDFGIFREQMCTITCPYARMQSVLLDPDSLIVSYDPVRGEPRGRRTKAAASLQAAGATPPLGDCVDCGACVRTCPTGIDIRDGLQMECIACTQCIDACDAIMDRIDKPRGLIDYTSEKALAGGRTRVVRPRTVLYAVLFLMAASAFTVVVASRSAFDVNIGRAVGEPYSMLPGDLVANRLRFRVRNQTGAPSSFWVEVTRPEGAQLSAVGAMPVPLEDGQMERLEVWITVPEEVLVGGKAEADFVLHYLDGSTQLTSFLLLGPNK
ncbi:MAG: cytochrome c oxidase accessory protein FixG [Rhodothermales bacterium]